MSIHPDPTLPPHSQVETEINRISRLIRKVKGQIALADESKKSALLIELDLLNEELETWEKTAWR